MNVIFIVKIAFFISVFSIVFSLLSYVIDKKVHKNIYTEKNSIMKKIKAYLGMNGDDENNNLNWYFRIKKHLKATGTPYDLNANGYLLLKVTSTIAGFAIAKLFIDYLAVTIILPVVGFFFLDIMIYSKIRKKLK